MRPVRAVLAGGEPPFQRLPEGRKRLLGTQCERRIPGDLWDEVVAVAVKPLRHRQWTHVVCPSRHSEVALKRGHLQIGEALRDCTRQDAGIEHVVIEGEVVVRQDVYACGRDRPGTAVVSSDVAIWLQRLRSSLGGGTDVAAAGRPSTSDTAPGVERAGMITGHAQSTVTDPCKSPNMTTTSGSAS